MEWLMQCDHSYWKLILSFNLYWPHGIIDSVTLLEAFKVFYVV
jgi:hypothetical protein